MKTKVEHFLFCFVLLNKKLGMEVNVMNKIVKVGFAASLIFALVLVLAACGERYEDGTYSRGGIGSSSRDEASPHHIIEDGVEYDIKAMFQEWADLAETVKYEHFDTFLGRVTEIIQQTNFIPEQPDLIAISPNTHGEWVVVEGHYFVRVEDSANGLTVVFHVTDNTVVLFDELEVGMVVTGVFDTLQPITLQYPPTYRAVALVEGPYSISVGRVSVNEFTNNVWLNFGTTHISARENTMIVFQDGTPFYGEHEEINGRKVMMFFRHMATSMPGWANAEYAVVLFETAVPPILYLTQDDLEGFDFGEMSGTPALNPSVLIGEQPWLVDVVDLIGDREIIMTPDIVVRQDDSELYGNSGGYVEAVPPIGILTPEDIHGFWVGMFDVVNGKVLINGEVVEMPDPYVNGNGFLMVSVADVARALGYNVVGEGADIVIGMGTTFIVGQDAYFIGRMAPIPLGEAPELVGGNLFVPLNFFTELLNETVFVFDGNIVINSFME